MLGGPAPIVPGGPNPPDFGNIGGPLSSAAGLRAPATGAAPAKSLPGAGPPRRPGSVPLGPAVGTVIGVAGTSTLSQPLSNGAALPLPDGCTGDQGQCISATMSTYCETVGLTDPTCAALAGGTLVNNVVTVPPVACVLEHIETYMCCDSTLSEQQKTAAYEAYVNATKYTPLSMVDFINDEQLQSNRAVTLNAVFFFVPVMLLILIIIWIFVGTGHMNWPMGIFFSLLTIIILYGFSVAYRVTARNSYDRYYSNQLKRAKDAEIGYRNGVAYMLQGLLAASCAITSDGTCAGGSCWTCNPGATCANGKAERGLPKQR